ncbi:MAG: YncE family protein, partial [Gammaproteobacteria bacterium]|nr:YncE family protein [Gammaproteobacteria bacterium]
GSETARIDVGDYPEGIDYDPVTDALYVANWFDNTVSIINPATLRVETELDAGDGSRAFGAFILH